MKCANVGCPNQALLDSITCHTCLVAFAEVPTQSKDTIDRRQDEASGGDVNYYLLEINEPKRLDPYKVECEDIIEKLELTFAEGNVLKAIWRSAAKRVFGHAKRGTDDEGIYDGDKIAYYGERVKVQRRRKAKKQKK